MKFLSGILLALAFTEIGSAQTLQRSTFDPTPGCCCPKNCTCGCKSGEPCRCAKDKKPVAKTLQIGFICIGNGTCYRQRQPQQVQPAPTDPALMAILSQIAANAGKSTTDPAVASALQQLAASNGQLLAYLQSMQARPAPTPASPGTATQPSVIILHSGGATLAIPGSPLMTLPIGGQPLMALPITGSPLMALPVPGTPKQVLPPTGTPGMTLPVAPAPAAPALPAAPPAPTVPAPLPTAPAAPTGFMRYSSAKPIVKALKR
jgi:hypothetical protein